MLKDDLFRHLLEIGYKETAQKWWVKKSEPWLDIGKGRMVQFEQDRNTLRVFHKSNHSDRKLLIVYNIATGEYGSAEGASIGIWKGGFFLGKLNEHIKDYLKQPNSISFIRSLEGEE